MVDMNPLITPLALGLGAPEMLIILGIIVLLFGASKLPELARGSGRALRIFKAETKGLMDEDDSTKTPEQRQLETHDQAQQEARDNRRQEPEHREPGSAV